MGAIWVRAFVLLTSPPIYADSGPTTGEVTDRPTLKAFVEKAKNYLEGLTTVRQIAQIAHFFRVYGPWNAGDMFLITIKSVLSTHVHGRPARETQNGRNLAA